MYIYKDLDELIMKLHQLLKEDCYLFRGVSKQEHRIPLIIRANLQNKEMEMLKHLEKNAAYHIEATDFFGFVAQAQHYGLPTRLLDFSHNPFVALYFSIFKPMEEGRQYSILYSKYEKDQIVEKLPMPVVSSLYDMSASTLAEKFENSINAIEDVYKNSSHKYDKEKFKKVIDERKILFVDSTHSNLRLIMQQGVFMLPYTLDQKEHLEILKNNTEEIRIDSSIRKQLLEHLHGMGVNAYKVMPDLASICGYISKLYIEGAEEELYD